MPQPHTIDLRREADFSELVNSVRLLIVACWCTRCPAR